VKTSPTVHVRTCFIFRGPKCPDCLRKMGRTASRPTVSRPAEYFDAITDRVVEELPIITGASRYGRAA